MWAVAAQPRTGLTPMIPTPSFGSGILVGDQGAISVAGDLTRRLAPTIVSRCPILARLLIPPLLRHLLLCVCSSILRGAVGPSSGCRDGGVRLAGVDHVPVERAERLDTQGGVHSARLHRIEPGCRDEPLDRGGSLVVIGRVEQHRSRGP